MSLRAHTLVFLTGSMMALAACGDDDAADTGSDAATPTQCGTWTRANFRDQPPANATAYGMEYNPDGNFSQFVCRFRDELDGKPIVLQGKGVFGYSCYAILPAAVDAVARVEPSADFEVLTDSQDCARMVPFQEDQASGRWLPTGTDALGNPTYTCRGVVKSLEGGSQPTSRPLGRYEAETKRCVFEWYSTVRAAPGLEATESFEMLAVP